jgi:hypothetical protein
MKCDLRVMDVALAGNELNGMEFDIYCIVSINLENIN